MGSSVLEAEDIPCSCARGGGTSPVWRRRPCSKRRDWRAGKSPAVSSSVRPSGVRGRRRTSSRSWSPGQCLQCPEKELKESIKRIVQICSLVLTLHVRWSQAHNSLIKKTLRCHYGNIKFKFTTELAENKNVTYPMFNCLLAIWAVLPPWSCAAPTPIPDAERETSTSPEIDSSGTCLSDWAGRAWTSGSD